MNNHTQTRRVHSIKNELVAKSREAALAAVQIFNNPTFCFKSEAYIVLMIIAWTYLLHAYYRREKVEYRYTEQRGKRKVFTRTKCGAYKFWELERCINCTQSPLDNDTANNLRFLIGLRHEIEHKMTTRIDDMLSARFQACCLNFNEYIKKFFGDAYGIEKHLSFSLQFTGVSMEQKGLLDEYPDLPKNISAYIAGFDITLSETEFSSPRFAYRLFFVPKTANHRGQADRVIEFVKSDSHLAENINKEYAVIKETEKKKYLPKQIVDLMKSEGFIKFRLHEFARLWKLKEAKDPSKGYGTYVAGNSWYWFESWVTEVRKHCQENSKIYT